MVCFFDIGKDSRELWSRKMEILLVGEYGQTGYNGSSRVSRFVDVGE